MILLNLTITVPQQRIKQNTTGKQRKSNVNVENSGNEFLQSQLDTCKGLIAQKDLEFRKLKESNDLRGKRISNLESLAQESRNFIIKQSKLFKHNDVTIPYDLQAGASSNCDHVTYSYSESNKINDLESKSNSMQHQITLLTYKLDTLEFQFLLDKNTLCDDSKPIKSQPCQERFS